MSSRVLPKDEYLRHPYQTGQELLAALDACPFMQEVAIPPPRLKAKEKTPEKVVPKKNFLGYHLPVTPGKAYMEEELHCCPNSAPPADPKATPKLSNKKTHEQPMEVKDANQSLHLSDFKKSEKEAKIMKHSSGIPEAPKVVTPPFSPPKSRTSTPKYNNHTGQSTDVVAEIVGPIGYFKDDQGNDVWVCPTCRMEDDGSAMIGCDHCDDWYHWECVGIEVAPHESVNWFCPRCTPHQKQQGGGTPDENEKRGSKRKRS